MSSGWQVDYRLMFQDSPSSMLVYDIDNLEVVAANRALLRLYGYAEHELVGHSLLDLWVPDERPLLVSVVRSIVDNAATLFRNLRWRTLRKDGEELVIEVTSNALPMLGRQTRLVQVAEVADKLRVERLAADQARFLESLLDALPTPVFYKDRLGRYLGGNQAYFSLLGLASGDCIGKMAEDIASPELAARYRAADDALFARPEEAQIYEATVPAPAGETRNVIFHKAAFRDHLGEVAGLIGIIHDITEQRRVADALRESEGRLMQVLHNSPLPVFVIDDAHRVVLWNAACERGIGCSAESMLGRAEAWRAFYPTPRPVMADLVVSGADEAGIQAYYGTHVRRSPVNPDAFEADGFFPDIGNGRWFHFSASPLRNAEGRIVGAIETLIDITERKQAEAEAAQLNDELEQRVVARTAELARANEDLKLAMAQLVQSEKLASLGTLVAGVAHELNTPLGNMRTVSTGFHEQVREFARHLASNTLRRSTLDDFVRTANEAAAMIERNALRASELVSDFKQVAVDQTSTRRRKFDLAQVVHEILATMRPRLKHSPHQLEVDVPAGIEMDSFPGPLEQVLLNFFNNSVMHAFAEGATGHIRISAGLVGERVTLTYADDGCGMDTNTAAHAFDPFFTTRLGNGGSGLGLYIVFNLVTAVLGGEVRMDSRPGAGTSFHLRLPRVAPAPINAGE